VYLRLPESGITLLSMGYLSQRPSRAFLEELSSIAFPINHDDRDMVDNYCSLENERQLQRNAPPNHIVES
jgi:hypothetical protein